MFYLLTMVRRLPHRALQRTSPAATHVTPEDIASIRRFNQLVTQRTGALEQAFLGVDRPLGESRVLFEVGHGGAELRQLRERLGLDSGYLTRLLNSLKARKLIVVQRGADDERVRVARLTPAGDAALDDINGRAEALARSLLEPLSEGQRRRLVDAMAEVHRLLKVSGLRIERVHPAHPDARACVAHYFAELDRRFQAGFDPTASLGAEDADLVPPRGAFLVARADGQPLASGALKGVDPEWASIKRMWVDPSMRGLGLGRRMLAAIEEQARELGFTSVQLETNGTLVEARQLYASAGYEEVARFSDDPYAQHWFRKSLLPEP